MESFDVEHGGRTWSVGKPTRNARDVLEKLVVQAAWSSVEDLRGYAPGAFAEAKAEFARSVQAGEFKAGGRAWAAGVSGPEGNTLFLLSLLRERHPEATAADARTLIAERPDAVEAALAAQVPRFFALLADLPETPPEMRARFRQQGERATTPPSPPSA